MVDQIISLAFLTGFLASAIRSAVPIAIAGLGETISERAGVLNIGVEGIMLLGSFAGFAAAYQTGNQWLGLLAGALAGGLVGLLMAVFSVRFLANQIVAGLGIWIFCQGLTSFLNRRMFGAQGARILTLEMYGPIRIPLLGSIPVLGDTLFNQNILVYLTLIIIPLLTFILKRTSWGLQVDAVGENPHAADAAGINVLRVRYLAVFFGGVMAGLGGAYLPLALFGIFTTDLSTGLGWMAIAVVFFGKWRPWAVVGGSLVFGAANALSFRLQAMSFPVPYQFLLMIPYVTTILFVIFFVRGGMGPSALAVPFKRSDS
jgi:ABC-type uncharacterized transport system permease subunit